jgi:hypothetical protein
MSMLKRIPIWIPIRILDPDPNWKLANFFFLLKFLHSLIFKTALHQLYYLATYCVCIPYCLCIKSLPHACEQKVHI